MFDIASLSSDKQIKGLLILATLTVTTFAIIHHYNQIKLSKLQIKAIEESEAIS